MKPIFFAILMTISFFAQTSQAAEPKMSSNVITAFETNFAEAENAQWSTVENLFKVTFNLDDRAMFAFYDGEGDLVVTGTYLTARQLPKPAQKRLAEAAKGYTITEVFEINDGTESKYYVSLVNDRESKVLESKGVKWDIFKSSCR
jgi:hypothetical protein